VVSAVLKALFESPERSEVAVGCDNFCPWGLIHTLWQQNHRFQQVHMESLSNSLDYSYYPSTVVLWMGRDGELLTKVLDSSFVGLHFHNSCSDSLPLLSLPKVLKMMLGFC
jgi:hypothetical protein